LRFLLSDDEYLRFRLKCSAERKATGGYQILGNAGAPAPISRTRSQ
jgi:hypothetical protein